MKTKADRMWEEFGANLAAILRQEAPNAVRSAGETAGDEGSASKPEVLRAQAAASGTHPKPAKRQWWARLVAPGPHSGDDIRELRLATDIYFEVHRGGDVIKILWPAHASAEAIGWVKEMMRE
jgi:hypothetical protein